MGEDRRRPAWGACCLVHFLLRLVIIFCPSLFFSSCPRELNCKVFFFFFIDVSYNVSILVRIPALLDASRLQYSTHLYFIHPAALLAVPRPRPRTQVVCTAEQGKGLEILGAFVLRAGALYLDVDVSRGVFAHNGCYEYVTLLPIRTSRVHDVKGLRVHGGPLC